jgi:hypothetical protein
VEAGDKAVVQAKSVVDRAFDNTIVDATAMMTSEKDRDEDPTVHNSTFCDFLFLFRVH